MSQDYHFRSCDIFSTRSAGRPGCKRASYGCLTWASVGYLCVQVLPKPFSLSHGQGLFHMCVCHFLLVWEFPETGSFLPPEHFLRST